MKSSLATLALATAAASCTNFSDPPGRSGVESATSSSNEVILASEVRWEQLNPARGDKSPKAGTLWGDRKGTVPTGYLIKFEDDFSSPPHIHNVSYRGVVLSGLVHNDDPSAAHMWMPPGSFWTQPKGEVHITAAKGSGNMAYIEIDEGPYLVLPTVRAFDSGERPVNVDASNIVWQDASILRSNARNRTPVSQAGAKVAFLWGTPSTDQFHGAFVKLPSGFHGRITTQSSSFRAIVIKGQPRYGASDADPKTLAPGSYFGSSEHSTHRVSSSSESESVLYIRTNGSFEVVAGRPEG